MRWTQEELATGLARNAAQRDPSLGREALAGLVGAVMKRIPDQKAYGHLEAERAYEILRSEQDHRAVVAPMLADLGKVAASLSPPKTAPPKTTAKPAAKPKARPVPTAAQVAQHRQDMAAVERLGKQLRDAVSADRAVQVAKARAVDEKVLPGGRISRLISRSAKKIIFEIRAA